MKQLKYYFFLPVSIALIVFSCSPSADTVTSDTSGNWLKRSEFEGNARSEAVSFTIGDTSYIGTGYNGTTRFVDFWAYDPVKNFWLQRAQFPGVGRTQAVGFTVGAKGYIATGIDALNLNRLADNWEYTPATNTWAKKADFAGTARYDAVAFGIADKGYISTGFDGGYTKDLWEFTPATNTWVQKVSLGGSKRSGAVAFVYNNKAYVLTGTNNGQSVTDFWVYDPANGSSWTQLRDITNVSADSYDDDYTDIVRTNAVAFVIGTKAYLSTGENGGYTTKTWEYDLSGTDTWARKTPYERSERSGAVAFTVKGRGFVTCGRNSTYYFDDIDEFQPDIVKNDVD